MADDNGPAGGTPLANPVWDAWPPAEIARRLAGVRAHWYVAGGWALDLSRGKQQRDHDDLEIGVPAASFGAVRDALSDYPIDVVAAGRRWPLDSPAFGETYQTWVREPATGVYRADIFREPHDGGTWICRRDETIRLPYQQIIRRTPAGIPYLAPEIVLLFKAKHVRPKDAADFEATLPLLRPAAVEWLRDMLARVHPGHAWLGAL
jgi:hypothetical protein